MSFLQHRAEGGLINRRMPRMRMQLGCYVSFVPSVEQIPWSSWSSRRRQWGTEATCMLGLLPFDLWLIIVGLIFRRIKNQHFASSFSHAKRFFYFILKKWCHPYKEGRKQSIGNLTVRIMSHHGTEKKPRHMILIKRRTTILKFSVREAIGCSSNTVDHILTVFRIDACMRQERFGRIL